MRGDEVEVGHDDGLRCGGGVGGAMVRAVMHECSGDHPGGDFVRERRELHQGGIDVFWGRALGGRWEGEFWGKYFACVFKYIDFVVGVVGLVLESK